MHPKNKILISMHPGVSLLPLVLASLVQAMNKKRMEIGLKLGSTKKNAGTYTSTRRWRRASLL